MFWPACYCQYSECQGTSNKNSSNIFLLILYSLYPPMLNLKFSLGSWYHIHNPIITAVWGPFFRANINHTICCPEKQIAQTAHLTLWPGELEFKYEHRLHLLCFLLCSSIKEVINIQKLSLLLTLCFPLSTPPPFNSSDADSFNSTERLQLCPEAVSPLVFDPAAVAFSQQALGHL